AISPQFAAIGTGQSVQFTSIATNGSGVTWSASAGTINSNGVYVAPSGTQSATVTITATSKVNHSKTATAMVNVVAPGQVTSTTNVQVANYMVAPAAAGNVSVQFGTSTNYGLTTWTQPVPTGGGPVSLFVAGMRGNTLYHMRGVVQFADGSEFLDADQTFTTQAVPAANLPVISTTTTPGTTPQSGVELLNLDFGPPSVATIAVTDLAGDILWSYNPGSSIPAGAGAAPVKLLPNGNFLINFATITSTGISLSSVLQEVDLTGKVVWQMTDAQLNQALAAAPCSGCNITILATHHDFVELPNGHLVILANTTQDISGTTVYGDVIIDLDQNHNPVWVWNEFDHLDTNRRPYMWPDWTHTNAILYSPDDGNLIISIRHQNWLVKIDYENGNGTGNILWHLGYQGDFTLVGGTDPTDWFYAQHGPSFTTTNTTGQFGLAVFDNGDDRFFPSGQVLCTAASASCYSTVPVFDIDETSMTATLNFHMTAPYYNFFGGNNGVLANGDIEFCEAAEPTGLAADVYEVNPSASAQTVWHTKITGQYAYRGQRIGSMYPGVQW
ncbi:MAG TPA: aryl-sulfate sulfotransferase, partial [Verrucomicrobiae bacterium]|nr:aryl-sulfate sulfotransferase [Verrucomicrobiae bacterium]